METIQQSLESAFKQAIHAAFGVDADPLVTISQNEQFGDYQSNAAMGLSKTLSAQSGQKLNPRQIAEQIIAKLQLGVMAAETPNIAGPGFINVKLSPAWLASKLHSVEGDERLGVPLAAARKKTVVDYSGPNIAKQMHVGHLRSTIIGDAISRVMEFQGNEVVRQNHIGDWGTQFGRVMLGLWYEAASAHFRNESTLTDWIARAKRVTATETPRDELMRVLAEMAALHQQWIDADPDGLVFFESYLELQFPNLERLEELYTFVSSVFDSKEAREVSVMHCRHGQRTFAELPRLAALFVQNPNECDNRQESSAWRKCTRVTLEVCRGIYSRLGVLLREEHERGESFYNPYLPQVVKELKDKGLAVESEGATAVFVDGPDKPPMIIEKTGGGFLYATTDLAGVWYRTTQLGAKHLIYTHDSRQANHFRQVFDTARKVGWAGADVQLDYTPFGTMLGADGKPFKTRSGDTVKLKDLLDEAEERGYQVAKQKSGDRGTDIGDDQLKAIGKAIGIGAIKYADLSKDRTSDYVFSWEKMLSMEGNTAPYLQYAYARIRSIQRKARSSMGGSTDCQPVNITLDHPHEQSLAKHLLRFGEAIEVVARDLKPHLLCLYLYDLATKFSGFYENCPVIQSEEPMRSSRLALCEIAARTFAQGLDLLGIDHPEQM